MRHPEYYTKQKFDISASHGNTPYALTKDFHFHDNYELFLFLNGEAQAFVEQSRYMLRRGSLLTFNPNEIHKASNLGTAPYERITVHFNPKLIYALPLQNSNLLACFQNHMPGVGNAALLCGEKLTEFCTLAEKLIALLSTECYGKDALTLAYLAQLLVMANEAFLASTPAPLPMSGFVAAAMAHIDANLAAPLSLAGIARYLNVDSYYLSHQFKTQTGGSLYHYILMKKISLAKTLLAEGNTVTQVCEQAGFQDYNNFIRTFKKYDGLAPGQYKKQFRP